MLNRIEHLDYLRAIAIIPVLIFHYQYKWMPGGALGVAVFFALSGFLITRFLQNEPASPAGYGSFLIRRMGRILPLYFAVVATAILLLWLTKPEKLAGASIFHLALMLGTSGDAGQAFGVLWSLQVEFWFYLLFPLVFLPLRNRLPVLLVIAASSLAVVLIPSLKALVQEYAPPAFGRLALTANAFAFGSMAALANIRSDRTTIWRFTIAGAAIFILVCYATVPNAYRYEFFALVAAATALIMAAYPLAKVPFTIPVLPVIAAVSYSLYMTHAFIIDNFDLLPFVEAARPSRALWPTSVYLIACLCLALLAYAAIEKPSQTLARRLSELSKRRRDHSGYLSAAGTSRNTSDGERRLSTSSVCE